MSDTLEIGVDNIMPYPKLSGLPKNSSPRGKTAQSLYLIKQ
jgi:hypothetical protein